MRIVLLHNVSAGSEDRTDRKLEAAIERAGHEIVAHLKEPELLSDILATIVADCVAVAGGDGTVGRAAAAIAGSRLPLAILPVGTANNIARSLGILVGEQDLSTWISAWHISTPQPFDLAMATSDAQRKSFAETLGFGVFPEVMRRADAEPDLADPSRKLERDLALFRDVVIAAEPAFYTLQADGNDHSGEYLLVEVMNIPLLGANLALSSASDSGDGVYELCWATSGDRELLLDMIETTRLGRTPGALLPSRPIRQVTIRSTHHECHIDGEHWKEINARATRPQIDIVVQPAALQVLVPNGAGSVLTTPPH
jgi:diacylglycerol kinase family enzyme